MPNRPSLLPLYFRLVMAGLHRNMVLWGGIVLVIPIWASAENPGNESLRENVPPVSLPSDSLRQTFDFDIPALPLVAHYTTLRQRLALRLGCPNLASECLHDTWLRLADASIPATVDNPGAYVYRIACNLATDRVRNSKPWQYISDADLELEQVADSMPGPAMIAEACSEFDEVMRVLQRLPLRHQSILLKLRLEEESRADVANRYGLSSRRVDKLLRQALDFCLGETEQTVAVGNALPRKEFSPRWLHTARRYDGETAAKG